jgi:hypothetical protein
VPGDSLIAPVSSYVADGIGSASASSEMPGGVSPHVNTACTDNVPAVNTFVNTTANTVVNTVVNTTVNTACPDNAPAVITEMNDEDICARFLAICEQEMEDICGQYKKRYKTISELTQAPEMTDINQVTSSHRAHLHTCNHDYMNAYLYMIYTCRSVYVS